MKKRSPKVHHNLWSDIILPLKAEVDMKAMRHQAALDAQLDAMRIQELRGE